LVSRQFSDSLFFYCDNSGAEGAHFSGADSWPCRDVLLLTARGFAKRIVWVPLEIDSTG
jgi:hypothetical protein